MKPEEIKERHNWQWNKPGTGLRQCSKCGKVSTIRSHSTLGGCNPKAPQADRPDICVGCPTFEQGCEGSNQEDCGRAGPVDRDQLAKFLYERQHPRLFHTFEELKAKYLGTAETICQEANSILALINPDEIKR